MKKNYDFFNCKILQFLIINPWSRIRIRNESNADPQHWWMDDVQELQYKFVIFSTRDISLMSHQFRSAWKWYRWVGLDEYMDRG
jgi:hypothetical protein